MDPEKEIPVIMVTTEATKPQVAEALRWGARDYVIKPFSKEVLCLKVQRLEETIQAKKCEDTSTMLQALTTSAQAESDRPFLSRLPPTLAQNFGIFAVLSSHSAGAPLIRAGSAADSFMVISKGEVEVLQTEPIKRRSVLGEGHCLAEESFLNNVHLSFDAFAKGPVQLLSISRQRFGEFVRKHPEFGFYVGGLLTRQPRRAPSNPEAGRDLSGQLNTITMADLVQILHITQKTGILRLTKGDERGGVYFDVGEVRHAWIGDARGDQAFYDLVAWQDAQFAFESGERSALSSVNQPTMSLLMEGMRLVDEIRRRRS
jgi:CRP-like cAMP-binding protein